MSGVLPSSTPTWTGRAGSASAITAEASADASATCSLQVQLRSPYLSPTRASSARSRTSCWTVSTGSGRLGGQGPADVERLLGGATVEELVPLGRREVPVRLAVQVDPDAAVHVHGRVRDAMTGVGG